MMEFVRWGALNGAMIRVQKEGALVLHDDAVRAVAEAVDHARMAERATAARDIEVAWGAACEQGRRDAEARIRAAVEALDVFDYQGGMFSRDTVDRTEVLAVIDAGGES